MGVLEDIRQWIKDTDLGRELGKLPERMTELEKRVASLEAQLVPAPGKRCLGCGKLGLRLETSRIVGPGGATHTKEKWKCEACGRSFEVKA